MPKKLEPWERVRVPDGWSYANVAGHSVEATRDPWQVKGRKFVARVPIRTEPVYGHVNDDPSRYKDQRAYRELQRLMDRWERRSADGSNAAFYMSLMLPIYGPKMFGLRDPHSPALSRVVVAPIKECRFYGVNGSELLKTAYFWIERSDGTRVEFTAPQDAVAYAVGQGIEQFVAFWSYFSPNNPVAMRLETFQAQFGAPRIRFDRKDLGQKMGG